ncbi:MAG: MarR family winged helix-turn-helix transcriptional regulator [Pseudomonadota bacterium]
MADFNLNTFLPYLLNQAAEAASLSFQQVYKDRYGMLRTEWRVLFHLGLYGQLTASEIGARASLHKTKVSRAVSRLEARRYLSRARDTADRRVEHLALTPAGQAVFKDLRQVAERYDADLVAALPPGEAQRLREVLLRLAGREA